MKYHRSQQKSMKHHRLLTLDSPSIEEKYGICIYTGNRNNDALHFLNVEAMIEGVEGATTRTFRYGMPMLQSY